MKAATRYSIALLWLFSACASFAALHEDIPGSDVPVHYVRLTGHGGNNETNLKVLKEDYQTCVQTHVAMSKPYQPLSADAMPPLAVVTEHEIYYAANRTLDVYRMVLHRISPDDCALKAVPFHFRHLRSSIGRCDIDMLKKEAKGICDVDAHTNAPYRVLVPPSALAGETTVVLNTSCQMHRDPAGISQLCIANPASGKGISPYPISPSVLNGGNPGVLMSVKSPSMTLTAQEIHWNMAVSAKLFSIPAGFKTRPDIKVPR